jgi:hypothetical protein
MPIHDWTRVDAGIFHHFHYLWIGAITRVLNQHLLPAEYYALAEQQGAGLEPDVLTLRAGAASGPDEDPTERPMARRPDQGNGAERAAGGLLVVDPRVTIRAETDVAGQDYVRPVDKLLTLAAYESGAGLRAFVEPAPGGDLLIDMPLYLEPGQYVVVPLEETYQNAFDDVPRRWRMVLKRG